MSAGNFRITFCRLCFCTIMNSNFQVIEEVVSEVLKVILPGMDLEGRYESVMCRTCSVKLFAALSFKSTCLDTEDIIFPYVTSEKVSVVDLKEIYLKEKGNIQSISISENENICRLCFQLVTYGFVSLNEVDVDIINKYIPQVNINATKDPVICGLCFDSLRTHGSFVKSCLDVQEQYVKSYIKHEETIIKADESDQDSDSSSHGLFGGTIENNKRKHVSEDAYKIMFEAPLNSPSAKDKYKNKFKNDLNHKPRVYKCGFQTNHKSNISSHKLNHKDGSKIRTYKYRTCYFKSKYKGNLKLHQLKHKKPSESQMYKCDTCNYETKYKGGQRKHQLKHANPSKVKMYKCDACNYATKYKSALKGHLIIHKDPLEVQLYKCDACSFESKYKAALKVHLLLHKDPSTGEMYKCSWCSYETKFKHYLKQHQFKHKDLSEIKIYKCDACNYETIYKSGLKKHQLKHKDPSEAQMYKCDACNFATKYKSTLRWHLVIHEDPTKVQMYKCDACDYETRHKRNLKQHLLTHRKL